LPVALQASRRAGGQENSGGEVRCSCKRRILVVDDNKDAAFSLSLMLQMRGHATRTAHDGQQAVDEAAAFRPEVVLLDIGLPRLNGFEACRRIREQPWGKGMVLIA